MWKFVIISLRALAAVIRSFFLKKSYDNLNHYNKYIIDLYTHCLLARKAVVLENIKLNGLSEVELSMIKLENVKEVLFQALLLVDVKFDDGKMYAELCSIFLKK